MWVKICGITNEEDALYAVAMGADALGFVFAAGSKRLVAVNRVADIVKRLPPGVMTIGVFRDDLPERVVDLVHTAGLRGAQLHGHEGFEQVAWVAERVEFTIKGLSAGGSDIPHARRFASQALLLDNVTPGSGERFDWSLAADLPVSRRLILAGGLDHRNVADAIRQVRPWGVDVSTAVEAGAGRKDAVLVRNFISNAKAAGAAEGITDDDLMQFDDPYDELGMGPYGRDTASEPYDWQEEDLR